MVRADMLDVDELDGKVAEKMEFPELRGTLWTWCRDRRVCS